ncbi:MAG: DUF7305 domain-containing protein [Planctomycetota bacterium]
MMEKTRRKRANGSILALTMVAVVIMAILGLVMITMGSHARVRSARGATDIAARTAADAGLTQAVRLMNMKLIKEAKWDNSTLPEAADVPLPHCDARFGYKVSGTPKAGFAVAAIGKSGFSERKVFTRLAIESMWFGIGVKQDVTVMTKTNFSTLPKDGDFTIRTNSTADNSIRLFSGTVIPGDVIVGPGGDVDSAITSKSTTVIEGEAYAGEEEIEFPDVVVPELPYIGALPAPGPNNPDVIELKAADSGIYDEIILGQGKKLQIVKGRVVIYVTGDVRLHQGSELYILDNNSVPALDLYLGGNMQADQGSLITTKNFIDGGTRLKIYGTSECESIVLMNSGDLAAAIYAPYANLELKNSGDIYGAFTGNNLEIKNSGTFVFDTRLLEVTIDDDLAYLARRWWEE